MSKWTNGVNEYVQELKEFLKDENLETTKENMLNGASNWTQYSYGGSTLIYDYDIAERLAEARHNMTQAETIALIMYLKGIEL